jgi:pimeloyl-ACP methyl ester carboxylesterase
MHKHLLAAAAALAIGSALLVAPATAQEQPGATSLEWGRCALPDLKGWRCGTLTVPMDWFDRSNPDTAAIALAVHRAEGVRRGTLTLNPGGPGSSSLLVVKTVMSALPARVKRHFDIVLWDPRGIGLSRPIPTDCTTLPPGLADIPATGPIDWPTVTEEFLSQNAAANSQCFEANRDVAPYLGTEYVVRDLEALRRALGVGKWTYWGMSYGTRIGLVYAQRYPERLRATVLDGSVQPNSSLGELAAVSGTSHQAALAMLAANVGRVHGTRMYRVISALNNRTYVDLDGREVTRASFLAGMFAAAASQALIPDAISKIDEAYAALFGLPRAARADVDYGSFYARRFVMCGDFSDRPTTEQAAAWASASAAIGSARAGQLTLTWVSWCDGVPVLDHPVSRLTRPLRLATPPVVLNASGDPATPWVWAREMATYFQGSSLITYDGVGHVLYGITPSRCVNDAVTAYLLRLERPGNLTCPYVPTSASSP